MALPWNQPECSSPQIAPGEVHVWRILWEDASAKLADLEKLVSAAELTRADAYRRPDDRHRFLVGRGVLRMLFGSYLNLLPRDVDFVIDDLDKPSVAPAANPDNWQFNLSHSGKWILLALAQGRQVGVDVERIRPLPELQRMAERCLSPREFAAFRALAHSEQQPAFFRCWVRKEAYVKGLGQGMRIPLDAFEVSFLAHEPARLERRWEGDASQQGWFFQELEMGDDYAAAVAVEGELMRVFCWDWRF